MEKNLMKIERDIENSIRHFLLLVATNAKNHPLYLAESLGISEEEILKLLEMNDSERLLAGLNAQINFNVSV